MNINEIEFASRFAWPALEEKELPFGVLRYSSGSRKRINSLNLLPDFDAEPEEVIASTEDFFECRNALPMVRVIACESAINNALLKLDSCLQRRSYRAEGETHVMTIPYLSFPIYPIAIGPESCAEFSLSNWLEIYYGIGELPGVEREIHGRILEKLPADSCLLAVLDESGQPLCCGFGAVVGRSVGLYNIVTRSDVRGKGYATQLIRKLLAWAADKEVEYAYLQVETNNSPAVKLYQKLGFEVCYSYWYRTRHID
jgi:GNAT superfamily N-acetyltransferase